MKDISITTEYIALGQFLKLVDEVGFGGEVKNYLATHKIWVNGELESRRGRKLFPGDAVRLQSGVESHIVQAK